MVFRNGLFDPDALEDLRARRALNRAAERTRGTMRVGDLLGAILTDPRDGAELIGVLRGTLLAGATQKNVLGIVDVLAPPIAPGAPRRFDGTRASFDAAALATLDSFQAALEQGAPASGRHALEALEAAIFDHLDPQERAGLGVENGRAAALLRKRCEGLVRPARPLFDEPGGRLISEEFSSGGWAALQEAAKWSGQLGSDRVLPVHLFLSLLGETEGLLEQAIRLQSAPGTGPARIRDLVAGSFRVGPPRPDVAALERSTIGIATAQLLEEAAMLGRMGGSEEIDASHLLLALLRRPSSQLASVIGSPSLALDLARLHACVEDALRGGERHTEMETAYRLPQGLLPSEDCTHAARHGQLEAALGVDRHFDAIERALCRRHGGHVLIVGARGVGKTTLIRELARRAARGDIPSLKRKRVLRVECGNIEPQDSAARLASVLAHVAGRSDVILAFDDIAPLLRGPGGSTNKSALRSALIEERVRLIGTLSRPEYEDLFAPDPDLAQCFTRVELEEPTLAVSREIVATHACRFEKDFRLTIEPQAIDRAVVLPSEYMLSERMPHKSLRILRRVCEDLDFDRTYRGSKDSALRASHVIRAVSEACGVPAETLAGVTDLADYEGELGRMVLGQGAAVAALAADLRLIKAGRKRAGSGPASVVLFTGPTGTGKTELAKAVAKLYSSSKRLQHYTMGNFSEPHSVSGLIGSPVGYHGHEQGGPLINALNSDPYGVFLLDEAEKAHPNVWKPFLNLFDEGWIVDQRGVKGFADRSIFILTSNVGAELVTRMSAAKRPPGEIVETVKGELGKVRNPHGNQIVFPPEFLARLDRVIVFEPLDRAAMRGITVLGVDRLARGTYQERFGKELHVADDLIDRLAALAHEADERSEHREGGRVANRLVREHVSDPIQQAERADPAGYAAANRIEIGMDPPGPTGRFGVRVRFLEVPPLSLPERIARTSKALEEWLSAQAASTLSRRLGARLDGAEAELLSGESGFDTAFLHDMRGRLEDASVADLDAARGILADVLSRMAQMTAARS